MIYEILKDYPLDNNFESDWLPVNGYELFGRKSIKSLVSIQFSWENVVVNDEGNFDGYLEIYISNDGIRKCFGRRIYINSESNNNDVQMLILNLPFRFIKINYFQNSINSGLLNVVANYS